MNTPNKLSILRIMLIPIIVIIYYLNPDKIGFNGYNIAIVTLFIFGSFTDYLDGYLARKNNEVTTFGKFLDPLADKLLVMVALLILMDVNRIALWIVLVILAREFIVTGIRLVAISEGSVIAAGNLGKIKTAVTMLALILLLVYPDPETTLSIIGYGLLYIAVGLTVISGVEVFSKNKETIFKTK